MGISGEYAVYELVSVGTYFLSNLLSLPFLFILLLLLLMVVVVVVGVFVLSIFIFLLLKLVIFGNCCL